MRGLRIYFATNWMRLDMTLDIIIRSYHTWFSSSLPLFVPQVVSQRFVQTTLVSLTQQFHPRLSMLSSHLKHLGLPLPGSPRAPVLSDRWEAQTSQSEAKGRTWKRQLIHKAFSSVKQQITWNELKWIKTFHTQTNFSKISDLLPFFF